MKKICVVIGSRANYSSIKSAMRAIQNHSELELKVVVMASALLDRYGSVMELIENDGFHIHARASTIIEGETPLTMAKSTGLGLIELPNIFEWLLPDVVITVGDRFETMATTLAAAYMNIRIAHTMGGEVSGTIDESIRHAVTKFAHIHFAACSDAAERIIKLGEVPENVHNVGCPRMDLVKEELGKGLEADSHDCLKNGVGGPVDINMPFLLVSQHPVTTEYGQGRQQIEETLKAIQALKIPAIMIWPNADAGSEDISRGLRIFREFSDDSAIHFYKNLPVDIYIQLMKRTVCLLGNSSSGIREGAFIGTPVVNIGTRQDGRQCGRNVVHVGHNADAIVEAVRKQMDHGPYPSDPIYGDGSAGIKIAHLLSNRIAKVPVQKRITY